MKIPILIQIRYIYVLKYSNADGYHYVGITNNPDKRLKEHRIKYGNELEMEILATSDNIKYAKFIEQCIIQVHGETLDNVIHNDYREAGEPDSLFFTGREPEGEILDAKDFTAEKEKERRIEKNEGC